MAPGHQNTTEIRSERHPNGAKRRFSAPGSCSPAAGRPARPPRSPARPPRDVSSKLQNTQNFRIHGLDIRIHGFDIQIHGLDVPTHALDVQIHGSGMVWTSKCVVRQGRLGTMGKHRYLKDFCNFHGPKIDYPLQRLRIAIYLSIYLALYTHMCVRACVCVC